MCLWFEQLGHTGILRFHFVMHWLLNMISEKIGGVFEADPVAYYHDLEPEPIMDASPTAPMLDLLYLSASIQNDLFHFFCSFSNILVS